MHTRPMKSGGSMIGALAALGMLLGACGGQSDGPRATVPSATVPTAPPASAPADPYAVPDTIDEAYVNKVLAALDAAVGDVVRLVVRERAVTPEAISRLEAIYEDSELRTLVTQNFQLDVDGGLSAYRKDPGAPKTSVSDLLSSRTSCVFAKVDRDYSEISTEIPRVQALWVALKRSTDTRNPTHWGLVYDGFQEDFGPPPDPCDP